jgi:lysophospholipase L1-like esterase
MHTTTAQLGGGTQYSLYRDYSIPTGATTMKVEWYAALGGGPTICGVQSFNGDESRGWEVFNGGHTGYIYENFSNQVTQVSAEAARIDPNYIFWYLGTNEQTLAQDPVADMEPDIRLVVEAVLAAAPNCRQVLVAPWTRVNDLSWTYPMASYVRSLEKLANYYELGFINLSDPAVHPQPGSEAAILGNYYNDTVHPSINGAAAVAELYANEILGTPYAPETSANIQNLKHDFFSTSGAVDNDALDVLSGEASLGLIVGSKIGLI